MPSKSVVVGSAVGLHARPAAIIAEAAEGLDATVTINGRNRHVISYLEDFLFEPARARTPI